MHRPTDPLAQRSIRPVCRNRLGKRAARRGAERYQRHFGRAKFSVSMTTPRSIPDFHAVFSLFFLLG